MLLPVFALAQDEHAFDKTEWERVTKDIDYSSDTAKERKKKDEKSTDQGGEAGGGGSSRFFEGGNASGIMKFIIIVLAVVVVALLLRSLLGLNKPKNKKINKKVEAIDLERIEENIHEANLDDFIRQALEQQQFALAIRLYYLAILKELSLKNAIHWKKDKTNKDYLREMRQTDLFGDFRELTAIFERVWYGESPIHAREFHQLEPRFRRMMQQINAIPTPATP